MMPVPAPVLLGSLARGCAYPCKQTQVAPPVSLKGGGAFADADSLHGIPDESMDAVVRFLDLASLVKASLTGSTLRIATARRGLCLQQEGSRGANLPLSCQDVALTIVEHAGRDATEHALCLAGLSFVPGESPASTCAAKPLSSENLAWVEAVFLIAGEAWKQLGEGGRCLQARAMSLAMPSEAFPAIKSLLKKERLHAPNCALPVRYSYAAEVAEGVELLLSTRIFTRDGKQLYYEEHFIGVTPVLQHCLLMGRWRRELQDEGLILVVSLSANYGPWKPLKAGLMQGSGITWWFDARIAQGDKVLIADGRLSKSLPMLSVALSRVSDKPAAPKASAHIKLANAQGASSAGSGSSRRGRGGRNRGGNRGDRGARLPAAAVGADTTPSTAASSGTPSSSSSVSPSFGAVELSFDIAA